MKEKIGKPYTLHLAKTVVTTQPYDSPASRRLQKRAVNARREGIWRELERKLNTKARKQLLSELRMLFHIEMYLGVKHTPIAIYEMETGRRIHRNTSKYKRSDRRENLCADDSTAIAPQVVSGKRRAPKFLLPLDDNGTPYVPTPDELFERAIFLKFVEKDNFAMALARLEKINPKKYGMKVKAAAELDAKVKRARTRVHSPMFGARSDLDFHQRSDAASETRQRSASSCKTAK